MAIQEAFSKNVCEYSYFFFGHVACGIVFLQQGIKPMPLRLEAQNLSFWTARKVLILVLLKRRAQAQESLMLGCVTEPGLD